MSETEMCKLDFTKFIKPELLIGQFEFINKGQLYLQCKLIGNKAIVQIFYTHFHNYSHTQKRKSPEELKTSTSVSDCLKTLLFSYSRGGLKIF